MTYRYDPPLQRTFYRDFHGAVTKPWRSEVSFTALAGLICGRRPVLSPCLNVHCAETQTPKSRRSGKLRGTKLLWPGTNRSTLLTMSGVLARESRGSLRDAKLRRLRHPMRWHEYVRRPELSLAALDPGKVDRVWWLGGLACVLFVYPVVNHAWASFLRCESVF